MSNKQRFGDRIYLCLCPWESRHRRVYADSPARAAQIYAEQKWRQGSHRDNLEVSVKDEDGRTVGKFMATAPSPPQASP